ncbi:MAG: phage tail protein [Lysobacter sp.]|jgi:phage tail-like protein|nr:phage tail protein [Lysobacter sp.]TXI48933.1 MAG: phage tail protein [Lysobacter sp.]
MAARASQFDPYRKFKFKIKIGGQVVAGLTKCSALTVSVESKEYRTGDMDSFKQKLPGMVSFEAITLDQGVTQDKTFEAWATAMSNYLGNKGSDSQKTPNDFRKDIDIEIYNLNNERVKAYRVYQCWVSKYVAVPDLDANSADVMIQTITLENEGIQVMQ